MDKVGKRIKIRRKALGLTQDQVSDAVNKLCKGEEGLSQPTLANLERGNNARTKYIYELAHVLGVSVEWLMAGDIEQFAISYLSPDEIELLKHYRTANKDGREFIQRSAVLAERNKLADDSSSSKDGNIAGNKH